MDLKTKRLMLIGLFLLTAAELIFRPLAKWVIYSHSSGFTLTGNIILAVSLLYLTYQVYAKGRII